MSPLEDQLSLDRQVDRLVDGELPEAQRRALLARLEEEPDGWRRCALAFLEAQCFRESLRPLRGAKPPHADKPARLPLRRAGTRWIRPLVLAASFFLAIAMGWNLHTLRVLAPEETGEPMVQDFPTRPATPEPAPRGGGGWQLVTLPVPGAESGTSHWVQVPVIEPREAPSGWQEPPAAELPSELLRALQRSGHEISRSRQMLRLPLGDGRRVVVPVDQFDVRFVGSQAYQ